MMFFPSPTFPDSQDKQKKCSRQPTSTAKVAKLASNIGRVLGGSSTCKWSMTLVSTVSPLSRFVPLPNGLRPKWFITRVANHLLSGTILQVHGVWICFIFFSGFDPIGLKVPITSQIDFQTSIFMRLKTLVDLIVCISHFWKQEKWSFIHPLCWSFFGILRQKHHRNVALIRHDESSNMHDDSSWKPFDWIPPFGKLLLNIRKSTKSNIHPKQNETSLFVRCSTPEAVSKLFGTLYFLVYMENLENKTVLINHAPCTSHRYL